MGGKFSSPNIKIEILEKRPCRFATAKKCNPTSKSLYDSYQLEVFEILSVLDYSDVN